MTTYVTQDGDMVDAIAFNYYGTTTGTVEQVLAANPGLADYGPTLPAGVSIQLPTIAAAATDNRVRLWQ